ncbi:hypothetical protein M514_07522, partial [Trichuris suis]
MSLGLTINSLKKITLVHRCFADENFHPGKANIVVEAVCHRGRRLSDDSLLTLPIVAQLSIWHGGNVKSSGKGYRPDVGFSVDKGKRADIAPQETVKESECALLNGNAETGRKDIQIKPLP